MIFSSKARRRSAHLFDSHLIYGGKILWSKKFFSGQPHADFIPYNQIYCHAKMDGARRRRTRKTTVNGVWLKV